MAFIEITKSGNSLIVDFGVYTSAVHATKRGYDIRDIVEIELSETQDRIDIMMRDAHAQARWDLTYDQTYAGDELFIVGKVDGVVPSSNNDLFNKINALR